MKRKRRSRAEWIKICEAYESSGESATTFAHRRGVNQGTLGWWHSKLQREGALARPSAEFVEVLSEPTARSPRAVVRVGAVAIEFNDEGPSAAWVAALAEQC